MSGFERLRYGLSSKTADSESTSVHSSTPSFPLQAGDVMGSCLEAPQRSGPALICPRGHTRMHTYKCADLIKFPRHSYTRKKKCNFHHIDVQLIHTGLFLFTVHLFPSKHITQSVTTGGYCHETRLLNFDTF